METKRFRLVSGIDSGNIRTKVSFLDDKGNIESFDFPTVAAPADAEGDPLKGKAEKRVLTPVDRIHVHIKSKALQQSYHYIGSFARDKKDMIQPEGADKHKSELHSVTALTGLAIAALSLNQEEVELSYSGGLPIEELKQINEEDVLNKLIDKDGHVVEFLDGIFEGKKVTLYITDGQVRVEGVTSSLGLKFNIINNKIVKLASGEKIGAEFALADLGAGTFDLGLFDNDGLNGHASTNIPLGTNQYIDKMVAEIFDLEQFKDIRKFLKDQNIDQVPYRNRDEFVKEVIKPGVEKIIDGGSPEFLVSWARIKDVNVTDIVLAHMKAYYSTVHDELEKFWLTKAQMVDTFALVGGGVLFGYYYFRDLKSYTLPSKEVLKDSAFFTSRAYLIANYAEHL